MASLGDLTKTLPRSTSREARRVTSAFLRGKAAKGSCEVVPTSVGKGRACHYESTGRELKSRGRVVATRRAPNTDTIEVCVNPRATAEERAAAGVLLRGLKAGIGVKAVNGEARITGRKGRAKATFPGCVQVAVSKKLRERAAKEIVKGLSIGPDAPKKKARKTRTKKPAFGKQKLGRK